MPKENEADNFYKLFSNICNVIDNARKSYYLEVSDEDRKVVKDFYNDIKNTKGLSDTQKNKHQKLLLSFKNRLDKTDDLSLLPTDFDVVAHLKQLNIRLGKAGQYYIEDYRTQKKNKTTLYEQTIALNSRNLFRSDEFLSQKDATPYEKQIQKLMEKFITGNSKASTELKNLLNMYDLEIKINNAEGFNGSLDLFAERKKAVLTLDKGLFTHDESIQSFMLAHELGHFIDYANRPQGTAHYIHQIAEECFADIIAATFTKQARFNLSEVVALFNKIENDPLHPKKEDRIAAIESLDVALTYSQQINKTYHLIQKAQNSHN